MASCARRWACGEIAELFAILRACLIIDQRRIFAEPHTRAEDGWRPQTFDSLKDAIPLAALNIEMLVTRVYADVAKDLTRN
ncbi:MAG: hypothetical protein OXE95_09630 [Chloroflexi bacterium]|nr:hypothetical protein [Chloroflexota bacterium]MCY4247818.1 hypothetical protein [Chloroflexota bacterium]